MGGAILFGLLNDPRRTGGPHYRTDWRAAGVGAAWGAGMIVGSWIYARARDRPTALLVGASTLVVGLAYVGMASSPTS